MAPSHDTSITAKLQRIRGILSVIAYRFWNFREVDVSRDFLKSGTLARDIPEKPPLGAEKNWNTNWELAKPIYGSDTSGRNWYLKLRDLPAKTRGRKVASLDKSVSRRAQEKSRIQFPERPERQKRGG